MYQMSRLISLVISVSVIFVFFYLCLLFLPIILILAGGYMLYQYFRSLWAEKYYKSKYFQDIDIQTPKAGKVIDAEFEILGEKNLNNIFFH